MVFTEKKSVKNFNIYYYDKFSETKIRSNMSSVHYSNCLFPKPTICVSTLRASKRPMNCILIYSTMQLELYAWVVVKAHALIIKIFATRSKHVVATRRNATIRMQSLQRCQPRRQRQQHWRHRLQLQLQQQ